MEKLSLKCVNEKKSMKMPTDVSIQLRKLQQIYQLKKVRGDKSKFKEGVAIHWHILVFIIDPSSIVKLGRRVKSSKETGPIKNASSSPAAVVRREPCDQ